ncbi:MAG: ATP-binding protein [Opitutaceae bacterium]|jgi:two-component system phosphate regulon sensor histidine kinase PhoR
MLYLVTLALAAGLIIALFRLRRYRIVSRNLEQAMLQKQPMLHVDIRGDDDCSRIVGAANDLIAEINRLQQLRTGQLAQLEATLGSLQEAVLIVDANNYILLANKALQAIFPSAKNILRQRLELVLRSVAFLNYVDAVRAGRAEPQHEIEFIEGNTSTWVEATGTLTAPLDGQRGPWALFVLHDITQQKKLESVRKDFVANVSHELRTPLSVIKGYIETLVDSRDMPVEDRERFLLTVQRHTERLNSLLEDLLALSRLESINPDLHREPTSLSTLITGLVDDYRARPSTKGHLLNFSLDSAVGELRLDPLKITQVFDNLLDNALKYAPRGSRIDISTQLRNDEVEVCVRDNGPGIPETDLPHIFERFYRVDKGRSREKGGTGLGLSIVKHIVQLHGGRVRCESQLGQGTAFFFSLPLRTGNG